MTSHDVRDVLNLPAGHSAGPRPAKKQKGSAPRPNLKGLAREVQSLGGDNPIAIVPEVSVFKKKRFGSRKPAAKWELRHFANSARGDDGSLVLRHWKRKVEVDAHLGDGHMEDVQTSDTQDVDNNQEKKEEVEDSSFAKFNVQVVVPQYSEDQYNTNLRSDDWTKEETDYLLQLVKDYDLRWPVIWDRYDYIPKGPAGETGGEATTAMIPAPKPRTMEDLKARYYEVAAKMMAVQKPAQYMTRPEFELYEIMTNFDPAIEKSRKQFAINTMARSKDEAREEESLLLEIKRILARTEKFNEDRRQLYQRLDYPHTDQDISAYKSSAGLQNLLQTLMNVDKSKKRRSLAAGPDGAGPTPTSAGFSNAQGGAHPSSDGPGNRRESIAASALGHHHHRDSLISQTPATPAEPTPMSAADKKKKGGGASQMERRKLSEQEELIYGVTHHDRLAPGPTFRYEKINKLYSHKSGQQQMRITNLLGELDVAPRLAMPTAGVTGQFEHLWSAVTALVDLRKLSDKVDAEIKLEEAKKAERDKARGIISETEKQGVRAGGDMAPPERMAEVQGKKSVVPDSQASSQEGGSGNDVNGEGQLGGAEATPIVVIKDEDGDVARDKEKTARPGSSSTHKRSASVLSTTSDKSTKRQKK